MGFENDINYVDEPVKKISVKEKQKLEELKEGKFRKNKKKLKIKINKTKWKSSNLNEYILVKELDL